MDSRNGVSINFKPELYRWIEEMVKKAKCDPLNYSNSTFSGFVQACVAKAKKEYEEKGSEIEKIKKRITELEKDKNKIIELEDRIRKLEKQ